MNLPPARVWADRNPEADKRLKAARAAVTAVSTELSIPTTNIGCQSNDDSESTRIGVHDS